MAALLWRKPKLLALFVACAAIHPVVWMTGNWLPALQHELGLPLGARRDGATGLERSRLMELARWYPITLIKGMTLPFGLLGLAGAVRAIATRHRSPRSRSWRWV